MDPLKLITTRTTLQNLPAAPGQVLNSAGGYVFETDAETRIRRFLTLGTSGTYYASAQELTLDNARVILDWALNRPTELVDIVVQVSEAGRAPKNNPALLALAAVASSGDSKGRAYALAHLNRVARTGTHLFTFAAYVEQFRGWGRGLRRAVADWYDSKAVDDLAYQVLKYRQRDGWTHRDMLRLSHPKAFDKDRNSLYRYAARNGAVLIDDVVPPLVKAYEAAKTADGQALIRLIQEYPLSWEMLPNEALSDAGVWKALIVNDRVPLGALIRQLPRLTRLGVLDDAFVNGLVCGTLSNQHKLAKARIHPVNVLVAQRTYASGHSARGDGAWTPNRHITDALDASFYTAFGTVKPAGKRTLIGLDVSGSMGVQISGLPISAREAAAALSLVQLATEPGADVVGFTGGGNWSNGWSGTTLTPLNISPRQRLDDVCKAVAGIPFGTTDCALPMLWAGENKREYDTFVIYTDNETYAGNVHPFQALRQYREATGIDAKLIVVGMTSTGFSIADPSDPGMLDVAGFDSAVPNLISDFSRGL